MQKLIKFSLLVTSLGLLLIGIVGCAVTPINTPPQQQVTKATINPPPVISKRKTFKIVPSPRGKYTPQINIDRKNRSFIPPTYNRNMVAQGVATWYGIKAHGAKTASGQVYDLYGMTAAHASLPFNTRVRVKNLKTGRSIVVTINDRLYQSNVLIKLSYQVARHLGLIKRPSQLVEIRVTR